MSRANLGVQQAIASPDLVLVQVVAAIDDTNKITNLMSERLTEWYALHFPEFKHSDPLKYAQVVMVFDRSHPDLDALTAVVGEELAQTLAGKANRSMGVVLSEDDVKAVRAEAQALLQLYAYRDYLTSYADTLASRIAPNISHIAGPSLAAKLIAQSGSLAKMASFPASTIQVLGAEKALFKHLRSGSPPPKHGLIFQHAAISTAPKWVRGKISRCLAAKLCIASKADALSHHFIADKLKEQFEARAAMLRQRPQSAKKPQTQVQTVFGGKTKNFGSSPKPSFGGDRPRPPFGGDRPRPAFGQDRPRPSFNGPRPSGDRPRPSFGGDRPRPPHAGGDRPRPPYSGGDRPRPSFGGDRPRPPFAGGDRPRPPYGGEGKPRAPNRGGSDNQPSNKPFGKPKFGNKKRY